MLAVPQWSEHSTFLSFFFLRYHPHPVLHSFPTRRSSDLRCSTARCRNPTSRSASGSSTSGGRSASPSSTMPWRRPRSEEHTSELQSHHDLVCRLLLEKKKNNKLRLNADPAIIANIDEYQV